MAMDIKTYDAANGYRLCVHMDTAKTLEDGSPDSAYVVEYIWTKQPPEGQTVAEYLQNCKREALLLAELELAKRQPPTEIVIS